MIKKVTKTQVDGGGYTFQGSLLERRKNTNQNILGTYMVFIVKRFFVFAGCHNDRNSDECL